MTNNSRRVILEMAMGSDLALLAASLVLASAVVHQPLWRIGVLQLRAPLFQALGVVVLAWLWHLALIATGAYKSYRITGLKSQSIALAKGAFGSTFFTLLWIVLHEHPFLAHKRFVLVEAITFCLFAAVFLISSRLVIRFVSHVLRRRGRNLRNIVIVGSNRRAVALADRLLEDAAHGIRLLGFIDDEWHSKNPPAHYRSQLIGGFEDILQILRQNAVDEVIITLPIASFYNLTGQIVAWCSLQGIPARSEGNFFDASPRQDPGIAPEAFAFRSAEQREVSLLLKKAFDFVFAAVAIILLSPVLLIVALMVKLTSEGPIFFKQVRLGLNKRHFRILKFRTMIVNAEAQMHQVEHLNQSEGPTFKLKNDPRITRIGSFLRKTSLDELPQLFNVLMGQMSLVGPRPLPLRDYDGFSADWHRRRFSVKPGLTCLWQISGRSTIGFDQWMEMDLHYIDRWTIGLDFEIILKTIPAVLRSSGAM